MTLERESEMACMCSAVYHCSPGISPGNLFSGATEHGSAVRDTDISDRERNTVFQQDMVQLNYVSSNLLPPVL